MHYSPVRHSPPGASSRAAVRLACVKHAASVQSEPGSNSSVKKLCDQLAWSNLFDEVIEPKTKFFVLHRVFAIKNTTEHPHKLSSQIVKERSELLSKEAGILPTFNPLSMFQLQIHYKPVRLEILLQSCDKSIKNLSFKFAYPCGFQRVLPPKKLRIIRTESFCTR